MGCARSPKTRVSQCGIKNATERDAPPLLGAFDEATWRVARDLSLRRPACCDDACVPPSVLCVTCECASAHGQVTGGASENCNDQSRVHACRRHDRCRYKRNSALSFGSSGIRVSESMFARKRSEIGLRSAGCRRCAGPSFHDVQFGARYQAVADCQHAKSSAS